MTTSQDSLDFSGLDEDMAAVRELAGLDELDGPGETTEDTPAELTRLGSQIHEVIERDRGAVAYLRSRPTLQRIGMVIALAAVTTAGAAAMGPTAHLGGAGQTRFTVVLVLVALITVLACWRLLRPLQLAPASRWLGYALLAGGVALPFLMAWALAHGDGRPVAAGATGFLMQCGGCFAFGAGLGLPVLGLALLVRRAQVDGPSVAALAGVAAGLTGYLTLHVHCGMGDPAHVMGGHASLLLLLGGAAALWRWRESR